MAEAEVNDEVQPNVVTQNVTSPFWSALEKSPLSLNNIQEVLSPSPITDTAGIIGKSKLEEEVKEDIEKQKQPAPVASLGSIINSDLPLNQIDNVPNNVLMNFTGQQLENARAYNQITQTNDPNNLPTLNMITDYEQLENLLKVGVKKAEKAVNPYPVGFMRDGEYVGDNRTFFGFMPNNQKSYAFNRQRLQNFALDIGLGNKPEIMNILNEHFTTGNFQVELGNRTQDLFVGGESFFNMLKIWGGDLIKSGFYGVVLNEEPDLNMFQEVFNNWNKNATNRTARYNQFLATLDNNNVMQEHTNRMNGLIKDKYIEKYGQQAYDNLVPLDKENLKLSTDQARQLYDFAFYEQNLLERTALFVVENIGVNLATGGAFKVVSSSLSNIPKLNLFPSEVAIYQTALVKQMTTRGDDGALIYSHTPISEIIRAEKLKSINKNGLMRSLGDLLTFGLSKRIRVGIAENAGEVGFLKHTKVLQNNPEIEKTYQQLNKQIANLNKLTDQGADATKINSARRLVEQTRDKLIVDSSRTISGNRFTIPSQYLKKLYGNEVVPSLVQALVYNIATDDNPESLRFAELYAAGGYMATAMGATRYAFALLGKVGGTAVPTYDDSVFAVNMILRSLRLPNILDESIIGTEFLDPVTLQKTTITVEDYKMIKYQKDKLMKLPVEVREEILTMGKASNERIAKMVALIDDKTVAKEIADDLSLGFAEMSGVLHFQALAHKLATSTALSDIVKATPTLQGALKYIDRSEKAIMAHTKVMSALRRRMVTLRQQGQITPENELKFKNLLDVNANIITGMKDHQNFLIKTVNDDFESIRSLITSDIVLRATPDEFRKQLDFLKEIQKSKHIRKTKLGLKVDKDVTEEFLSRTEVAESLKNISNFYSKSLNTLDNSISLLNLSVKNAKQLSNVTRKKLEIIDEMIYERADAIYAPLRGAGNADGTNIFNKVLAAQKKYSFTDGAEDKFLIHFLPTGDLQSTKQGRLFVNSMNKAARSAILKGVADEEVYMELRLDLADDVAEYFKNAVPANQISDVHFYQYLTDIDNRDTVISKLVGDAEGSDAYEKALDPDIFNIDNIGNIEFSFDALEHLRIFARNNKNKNVGIDGNVKEGRDAQYQSFKALQDLVEKEIQQQGADKFIDVTQRDGTVVKMSIAQMMPRLRLDARIDVYNRQRQGDLLFDFHKANYKQAALSFDLDVFYNTESGKQFARTIYAPDQVTRDKAREKFQLLVSRAFGKPAYPPEYIDADTGLIRLDLNLDAPAAGNKNITVADDIANRTKYFLDPDSEDGKAGIEFAKSVVTQLLKETSLYETTIRGQEVLLKNRSTFKGTLVPDPVGGGVKQPFDMPSVHSFLTNPDGSGSVDDYISWQNAFIFEGKNGKQIPLYDLDEIIKVETDIIQLMKSNNEVAGKINKEIISLNGAAKDAKDKVEALVLKETTFDQIMQDQFGINTRNKAAFVDAFFDDVPYGFQDLTQVNDQLLTKLDDVVSRIKQYHPDFTEDEVKAYVRTNLIEGVLEKGKVKNLGTGKDGKVITEMDNAGPAVALRYFETETMRKMLEQLDVDDEHYEALRATMAYLTIAKDNKNKASLLNPTIPQTRYTDAGLMARAFNYARGMVSTEYLLVEAGFRVMRENDMEAMNWLLNDKTAAQFMLKVLEKNDDAITTTDAKLFYGRMRAFIVNQLARNSVQLNAFYLSEEKALEEARKLNEGEEE